MYKSYLSAKCNQDIRIFSKRTDITLRVRGRKNGQSDHFLQNKGRILNEPDNLNLSLPFSLTFVLLFGDYDEETQLFYSFLEHFALINEAIRWRLMEDQRKQPEESQRSKKREIRLKSAP